jgi:alpha-L-rhamnosidase
MSTSTTASPLIPYDLRCEYKTNPMGIDVVRPRLSWKLKSDQPGQFQSAYQVQVASSAERLEAGKADLWDSGKVESDETIHIEYAGNPLASAQEVFWKVRVWDRDGRESRRSDTARWEMGLLDRSHWSARWVGSTLVGAKFAGIPVPFLRKEFRLKDRPVRARLYVTALGLYEVRLNGQRVGIDELAPGWTDYRYRVQYRTYDVTAQLSAGDNAIGAILATSAGLAGRRMAIGRGCWDKSSRSLPTAQSRSSRPIRRGRLISGRLSPPIC